MGNAKELIGQKELQRVLDYNPDTGVFTWRETLSNRAQAGSEAGAIKSNGYRGICIGGRLIHAHRLAFLYMEGSYPEADVDHINGNRDDNRWHNLRRASRSENSRNSWRSCANKSGVTGVVWHKAARKWMASIKVNYQDIYLGLHDKFDDAVAARKNAETRHGFSKTHGRVRNV